MMMVQMKPENLGQSTEKEKELKKGGAQWEEEGRVKSNKFVTNVMIMSVLHNSSHWTWSFRLPSSKIPIYSNLRVGSGVVIIIYMCDKMTRDPKSGAETWNPLTQFLDVDRLWSIFDMNVIDDINFDFDQNL